MADFPAIPLWTDAYLADTRHLSAEEHGAYLLLMMEAWRRPSCSIPDDDAVLARLTCLEPNRWIEIKPVVMAFWHRENRSKTWTQKRLSRERTYVAEKSIKNRNAAATRWNKEKKNDANAMQMDCPNDAPTPTPTIRKEREANASPKKTGSRLGEEWQLPEEWWNWAMDAGLAEPAAKREGDRFRDYWLGVPGAKGVKLDWQATWRNWVRTALNNLQISTRTQASFADRSYVPNHGDEREFIGGIVRRWDARWKEWKLPQDWKELE